MRDHTIQGEEEEAEGQVSEERQGLQFAVCWI